MRLRRRPAKTATNSRTSRAVFGEEAVKLLSIPEFIDSYNHFINGVDVADQLRSYYTTQRAHVKNWKPFWHFLLDTTVVNCYKIAHCTPERPFAESRRHDLHKRFRIQLAQGLFAHSERTGLGKASKPKLTLSKYVHPAREIEHGGPVRLGIQAKPCRVCICANRTTKHVLIRKPLQELKNVSTRGQNRRDRAPSTRYGCALCGINICNHKRCWNEHIQSIQ